MSDGKRRILTGFVAVAVIGYGGWAWYSASPVRPLAKAIRSGDKDEKATALHQLPQVVVTPTDVDLAIAVLLEALKDPVLEVRAEAAEAIRELYAERMRKRPDSEPRNEALTANQKEVKQALERGLGDPEEFVRQVVLRAYLTCIRPDRSDVPPLALLALLDDPSEHVRSEAMRGVSAYDLGLDRLLEVGQKRYPLDGPVGKGSFEHLLEATPFRSSQLPHLLKLLSAPHRQVRSAAITAIGNIGPAGRSAVPEILAFLRRELKDPELPGPTTILIGSDLIENALRAVVAVTPEGDPCEEIVAFLREFLTIREGQRWYYVVADQLATIGPSARPAIPEILAVFESMPAGVHGRYLTTLALAHLARGTEYQARVLGSLVKAWRASPDRNKESGIYEALIELRPESELVLPEVKDFQTPQNPRPRFRRSEAKPLVESNP